MYEDAPGFVYEEEAPGFRPGSRTRRSPWSPTQIGWGAQTGMARSAVRSRFLSLRHTKITCPNNENFIVATDVFAGDLPSDHRPGKSPARVRRPITLHCPGGSSMRSRDLPVRCAMGDPRVDDAPGRDRRHGARVHRGGPGSSTEARLLRGSTARPACSTAPVLPLDCRRCFAA